MSTPLYNELVAKYYLSRGIVPFSYPEKRIGHTLIVEGELDAIKARQVLSVMENSGGMRISYDTTVKRAAPVTTGYFNLKD